MNRAPPVSILTSGIGLGTYVPALLIERRLRASGCAAEVVVLEGCYTPERLERHLAQKRAMHESFALAQIAHRMAQRTAGDVADCLAAAAVGALLARWAKERRRHFIVWSGFWLPILERYRALADGLALDVDHCRIDAEVSASFRVYPELDAKGNPIWLWHGAESRIVHEIPATDVAPLPFAARRNRLVVHGGGWGIGTYRSAVTELAATGYALDVVVDDPAEARGMRPGDRAFVLDPAWHPWKREADGALAFPPMAEVGADGALRPLRGTDGHGFHEVVRQAVAVVSKPGGGTLIDSLAAATPVLLLEPYGYAERSSGALWERLGFGMACDAWRNGGCERAALERLNANLLRRAGTGIDYPRAYALRLAREEKSEAL